jgi:hypothetical protein
VRRQLELPVPPLRPRFHRRRASRSHRLVVPAGCLSILQSAVDAGQSLRVLNAPHSDAEQEARHVRHHEPPAKCAAGRRN